MILFPASKSMDHFTSYCFWELLWPPAQKLLPAIGGVKRDPREHDIKVHQPCCVSVVNTGKDGTAQRKYLCWEQHNCGLSSPGNFIWQLICGPFISQPRAVYYFSPLRSLKSFVLWRICWNLLWFCFFGVFSLVFGAYILMFLLL